MEIADRVRETSATTGTGALTLAGAATGFQSFSGAGLGSAEVPYVIAGQAGETCEDEWEVGVGTISSGTLVRDTVLDSSNAGSAVNFSAGTKDVFIGPLSGHLRSLPGIDFPWGGSDDLEFDRDNVSSLPSGFGWTNQGSAVYGERYGVGEVYAPAASGGNLRIITKTLPGSWDELYLKAALLSESGNGGLVLRDTTTGELTTFTINHLGEDFYLEVQRWDDATTFNASVSGSGHDFQVTSAAYVLLRITKNSASDFDFEVSIGGAVWVPIVTAHDPSGFMSVDEYGFYVNADNANQPALLSCRFLRVV